jgi:protein arginine kinase activator
MNDATFFYKCNINGQVSEQHLCQNCARVLGYTNGMERRFSVLEEIDNDMFSALDEFFAPEPRRVSGAFAPFERMFGDFDDFLFPTLYAAPASQNTSAANDSGNDLVSEEEHRKLNKERQLNALRCQMQAAVSAERFEQAASLRDQIHALEEQG